VLVEWLCAVLCSGDVDDYKARDDYDAAAAAYDYDDDVKDVDMYYGGGGGGGGQYVKGAAGKRSDSDTFVWPLMTDW